MAHRVRLLVICLTAVGSGSLPLRGQAVRQIPLNTATGTIDRARLPAGEPFDFLIRAASELREFRGRYRAAVDSPPTTPEPWVRQDGTKSRDATLRIEGLRPDATYYFTFVLVRRPTGNEGRLIETEVADQLRDTFRAAPDQPLEGLGASAAPRVAGALRAVLPRAVPMPGSPFGGAPAPVMAALAARGLDLLQVDYRRQLEVVRRLRVEFQAAREGLAGAPPFTRAVDAIATALARHGGYAELAAPRDACRLVGDPSRPPGPERVEHEEEQLALLGALKDYDATVGSCRDLFRDLRLPRYQDLAVTGTAAASDLFLAPTGRLEALRGETERLLSLTRKRAGALSQVATDLRRGLDAGVTIVDSLTASFVTAAAPHSASVSIGIGLAGVHIPCSETGDCLRIVPDATVNLRLAGLLGVELGLTLARTETAGRTRHLFWFAGGLTGLSVRLGERPQRLGAGAVLLRRDEPGMTGGFRIGWYVGFTAFDLRL